MDLRSLLVLMDLAGFALALIGAYRALFPLWRMARRQRENREKRARIDRMFEAEINQVNPHAADDPMQHRSGSSAQEKKLAEYRRQGVVYASYDTAAQLIERLIDGDYEKQLSRFKWDLVFVVAGLAISTTASIWPLFISP